MLNSDVIQPIGKIFPASAGLRIRFGKPLDFSRYADSAGDRLVERAITDEIMYELMVLSGREYVDVYAALVKSAASTPPPATPAPPAATLARAA